MKLSWSDDDFDSAYDLDHQQARPVWGLFGFNNQFETSDWSFEYSLATPVDQPWRAKLGLYYYDQERLDRQRSSTARCLFSIPSPVRRSRTPESRTSRTRQSSAASVSTSRTNGCSISRPAMPRMIWPSKAGSGTLMPIRPPVTDQVDYTAFTPRVTLQYVYSDDLNFYFLVAKGNKPGGFNTEFFRSDVPSEWTEFTRDCQAGDTLTLSYGGTADQSVRMRPGRPEPV